MLITVEQDYGAFILLDKLESSYGAIHLLVENSNVQTLLWN